MRLEKLANEIESYKCTITYDFGTSVQAQHLLVDATVSKARMRQVADGEETIVCLNCLENETTTWFRTGEQVAEQFALSVYDPALASDSAMSSVAWIPDVRTFAWYPLSIRNLPPIGFADVLHAKFFDHFQLTGHDSIEFEGIEVDRFELRPKDSPDAEDRVTVLIPTDGVGIPILFRSEFHGVREEVRLTTAEWEASGLIYVKERVYSYSNNGTVEFVERAEITMHSINEPISASEFVMYGEESIPDGTIVNWANAQPRPKESDLLVWKDGRIQSATVSDIIHGAIPEPAIGVKRIYLILGANLVLAGLLWMWFTRQRKHC